MQRCDDHTKEGSCTVCVLYVCRRRKPQRSGSAGGGAGPSARSVVRWTGAPGRSSTSLPPTVGSRRSLGRGHGVRSRCMTVKRFLAAGRAAAPCARSVRDWAAPRRPSAARCSAMAVGRSIAPPRPTCARGTARGVPSRVDSPRRRPFAPRGRQTGRGLVTAADRGVAETQSVFCVAPRRDGAGVRPTDHRRDGRQKTGWTKPQRYPSMGIRSSEAGRGQVSWPGGGPGVGGRSRRCGGCNAHTPPDTGAGRGEVGTGRRRTVCGHDESRIAGRRAAPTRPSTSCICPS